MTEQLISYNELRTILDYDPDTGVFRWAIARPKIRVGEEPGWLDEFGYRHIRTGDKLYLSHRLAWLYMYGKWPDGNLDHINGDPSDNRISNLREAPQHLNCRNGKTRRKNASYRSGISFDSKRKKFRAYITLSGTQVFLGRHDSLESAMLARTKAEHELFGEYRRVE